MEKVREKRLKIAIAIMLVVCIVLMICFQVQKYKNSHKKYANIVVENGIVKSDADYDQLQKNNMKSKLANMGERDRMEYYIAHFINCCENKRYDLAYELLSDGFKENYFETQSKFEEYAKQHFPSMADLNFDNIQREGNTYIMWVIITDPINGTKDSGVEYNFVIEEKDLNDINLAFSVK